MATIQFGTVVDSPRKVNKTFNIGKAVTGDFREECSLLSPVFRISGVLSDYIEFNYIYIVEFKRYYYIDSISMVRNNLIEFRCSIDVLKTYEKFIEKGMKQLGAYRIVHTTKPEAFKDCNFILITYGGE